MQVLIVDDDPDLGQAICETLEVEGHQSKCVTNGREALDHLRTGAPTCLILLDLTMPVMNGWEFRDEQLSDTKLASIPVVVITADGNASDKANELSANGYLQKPLRPENLLTEVGRYCTKAS